MYKTSLKVVTFTSVLLLSTVLFVCLSAFSVSAATLTTITVKEMDGVSTASYPLTFAHVFGRGIVTGSVYLNSYPTQTDVKTTWDDGSIKVAVISALIPIVANTDTVLNINTTGTAAGATPINKTEMLATDIGATIDLAGLSDSGYSGTLQADLRSQINAASTFDYWLEGDVVSEILIDESLNASLDASWEVRFYPSTSYIRISHSIENMKVSTRGNVNYSLEIKQGNASPASVYTKTSFQHNHSSRWRKVFWLGTAPPEVEIHYNIDYLISTGMIMPYDTSIAPSETDISSNYSDWTGGDIDIMGNGQLAKYFPSTGGRPEIGILPRWSALYLLTMDNRIKEAVLGHGELAGGIPAHYKEDNAANTFYGKVISLVDDPTYAISGGYANLPAAIGTTTTDWTVDRSHQGSFAYLPFIITGDKYFLDEVYYWAGYDLTLDSYRRSGAGNTQDFSAVIGNDDSGSGIIYDQMRAVAWGLRNINDAASIAPYNSDEYTYFKSMVENNIQWLYLGNTGTNAQGVNAIRVPREHGTTNSLLDYNIAPWMHDFNIIVLRDLIRKGLYGSTNINTLINTLGKYTVGRFTNDPTFNKWDGSGYWWPLKMTDSVGYFTANDWGQYYTDMMIYTGDAARTSFSSYDYPYSYAYISRAALSVLPDIVDSDTAFSFLTDNLTTSELSADPTWAFMFISPSSYISPPSNLKNN